MDIKVMFKYLGLFAIINVEGLLFCGYYFVIIFCVFYEVV